MEHLLITIFELLITFPGAAIVWLYFWSIGKKKSYSVCIENHYNLSSFLGFGFVVGLTVLLRAWL